MPSAFRDVVERIDRALISRLGLSVIHRPLAGGDFDITGIQGSPDENFEAPLDQYETLFVNTADLDPVPVKGDEIEMDGTGYTVYDTRADDEGGLVLVLDRN